jgi:glycosyltransferase involved in cell wall biosynthesis
LYRAQGVIAVSNGVKKDLSQLSVVAADKITVIPNPVIGDDFEERMNAENDYPWLQVGQPPVILGAGRLTKQNDFAMLIEAFTILRRKKNARLIILGEGTERGSLTALIKKKKLEHCIQLMGHTKNSLPFIKRSAVLAFSSRYEGFGNVIVEALACGTPIVSTNCPYGPEEILENGCYGKWCP